MLIRSLSNETKVMLTLHLLRAGVSALTILYMAVHIAQFGTHGYAIVLIVGCVYMIASGFISAWQCVRDDSDKYDNGFIDLLACTFVAVTCGITGAITLSKGIILPAYEYGIIMTSLLILTVVVVSVICGLVYTAVVACHREIQDVNEIVIRRHASKYGTTITTAPIYEFVPDPEMSRPD